MKLRKDYADKLKSLRVYSKFMKNWRAFNSRYPSAVKMDKLNKEVSFLDFIAAAFDWSDTPEGFYFWSNISDQ